MYTTLFDAVFGAPIGGRRRCDDLTASAARMIERGFGEEEFLDGFAAFGAHAEHRFGGRELELAARKFFIQPGELIQWLFGKCNRLPRNS